MKTAMATAMALLFFRADTGADMSRFYPRRYGQPIAPLI